MRAVALLRTDKSGRPNVYIKVAKYFPTFTTLIELEKYLVFMMDSVCWRMDEKVDQINLIFNTADMLMANFRLEQAETLGKMMEIYAERIHKVYFINTDRLFETIYNKVKTFIPENTQKKIVFTDFNELKKDIDACNLPANLGGTSFTEGEAFNTMAPI